MSEKDNSQDQGTNDHDEQDIDKDLEAIEDADALREEARKGRKATREATARAKKAEAALKEKKPPQERQKKDEDEDDESEDESGSGSSASHNKKPVISADDVDIKILRSQGVGDAAIERLQKIAALNGTSILDAQTDPLYVDWKAKEDARIASEKAKLGASHGSGSRRKGKDLNTPGLTAEEHKEMWKDKQQEE